MFEKKFDLQKVLLLFVLLMTFITGCDGQPPGGVTSEPQQPINEQSKAEIDIQHIEVHRGDQIVFSGETTLPEGECVFSQLFEDGTPVGWWPVDECFLVTDADWQFAVPLGEGSAPEEIDDSAQYRLEVWWANAPDETVDDIYFDLAGPQSP